MLLVGLTGGLGSGKSTVARMLQHRGAEVFDADQLARLAVIPGSPGYEKVVRHFGSSVVGPTGDIDREALATRVFGDTEARRALESIVHPEVFRLLAEQIEAYRSTDRVVVFDAPLIVETGFDKAVDFLVVVAASEEIQVARVAGERAMTAEEARARMAAQASTEEKERSADYILTNDGTTQDLERQVDDLWKKLASRARGKGSVSSSG
jgi:dephospho-CoA kinase